jgi:hypothetical protein
MFFYGILPSLNEVLVFIREELHLWCLAGAQGVSHLFALARLRQVTIDDWLRSILMF